MMTLNRCMTDLTSVAAVALMAGGVSFAQVMAPAEIKDPKLRALQSKHQAELTAAAAEMAAPQYPAKFYLTRELDLRSDALISADRRSEGPREPDLPGRCSARSHCGDEGCPG